MIKVQSVRKGSSQRGARNSSRTDLKLDQSHKQAMDKSIDLERQLQYQKQKNRVLKQTIVNLNTENTRLIEQTDQYQKLNLESYVDLEKLKQNQEEEKRLSQKIVELFKTTKKEMSYKTQTSVVYNMNQKMEKMEIEYKKLEKVSDAIYKSAEQTRLLMKQFQNIDQYLKKEEIKSMDEFFQKMEEMKVKIELQQRKIDELQNQNEVLQHQNERLKSNNQMIINKNQKNKDMINGMVQTQNEMKEMIQWGSKKMHSLKVIQEYSQQELQSRVEQNDLLSRQLGSKDMIIRDYESGVLGSLKKDHDLGLKLDTPNMSGINRSNTGRVNQSNANQSDVSQYDIMRLNRQKTAGQEYKRKHEDSYRNSENDIMVSNPDQYLRKITRQITTDLCFTNLHQIKPSKKISVDEVSTTNRKLTSYDNIGNTQKSNSIQLDNNMFTKLGQQSQTQNKIKSVQKL